MASTLPAPSRLRAEWLQALRGTKALRRFPKGATLIQQASPAMGVYLIVSGEVRVLLPTGPNQRQLVEVAGPGTMLGLSENVAGENYRIIAEAGVDTTAVLIPREEFLRFQREHCDFSMEVVRLLSQELHGLYHKFRSITAHPGRPRQRPLDEQLN